MLQAHAAFEDILDNEADMDVNQVSQNHTHIVTMPVTTYTINKDGGNEIYVELIRPTSLQCNICRVTILATETLS